MEAIGNYYNVQGTDTISVQTLEEMDEMMENFKAGKVSKTVDLSDF